MDSHSNGETQANPLMLADNQVITLVGCIILSAWPASFGVKMVGYFLLWLNNSGGPILIVRRCSVALQLLMIPGLDGRLVSCSRGAEHHRRGDCLFRIRSGLIRQRYVVPSLSYEHY